MWKLRILLLICFVYTALFASAQSEKGTAEQFLDEVTITAERRTLTEMDIPAAVSVISEKSLMSEASPDIRSIAKYIPNLYIQESGLKLSTPIYVRGVGSVLGTPSVGLYVDGAPIFDKNSFIFDLYDIEQVEMLKGPQSTLYGRNTINGLINIKSTQPTGIWGVNAQLGVAAFGTARAMVGVNLPALGIWKNKVSFNYNRTDGYFRNVYNNSLPGSSENYNARYLSTLDFRRGATMAISAEYLHSLDCGYAYAAIDSLKVDPYSVNYNSDAWYKRDIFRSHVGIKKSYSRVKIENVLAYSYTTDDQLTDTDYTFYDVFANRKHSYGNLISNEFNIQSDNTSKILWSAGVFAFYKSLLNNYTATFGKDRNLLMNLDLNQAKYRNNVNTVGAAAYGQLSVNEVWPGATLSLGLRYEYENSALEYHDHIQTNGAWIENWHECSDNSNFSALLPKFSLMQRLDQVSLYTTISKGYKAGGYNIIANEMSTRVVDLAYNSESLWNYELGAKFRTLNGRFRANTALYFLDWRDQQIFVMGMMGPNIENAGDAHSFGIDGDIYAQLLTKQHKGKTHNLDLRVAAGYTHATYYHNDIEEHIGNRIVMAPDFTGNGAVTYSVAFNDKRNTMIAYENNVSVMGTQYFDEANSLKQNPYALWNMTLTLSMKSWSFALWGKNLTDKHYFCYEFKSPVGSKKPEYLNSGQSGAPRNIGLTVSYKFSK